MSTSVSTNERFGTTGIRNIGNICFFSAPIQILYSIIPFRTALLNKTLQLESNDVNYDKDVDGVKFSKQDIVEAKRAVEELQRWFVGMSGTSNVYVPTTYLPGMSSYKDQNSRNGVFPEWQADDPFHFQEIPIPDVPPPTFEEFYGLNNKTPSTATHAYDAVMQWMSVAQVNTNDSNGLMDLFKIVYHKERGGTADQIEYRDNVPGQTFHDAVESLFLNDRIIRLPPVLVFEAQVSVIEIVEEMDLPFLETALLKKTRYVLHAFVLYIHGPVGHYVTYMKNHAKDIWYLFNDEFVKPVEQFQFEGIVSLYVYIEQDRLQELVV